MVYGGESRRGALKAASILAGVSLLPLTLGLACSAFVIFDRMSGRSTALTIATIFTLAGLSLLYGLGNISKARSEKDAAGRTRHAVEDKN